MSVKNKLVILAFVSVVLFGCKDKVAKSEQRQAISYLSPSEFNDKSEGQTIIDIRTPREFQQNHIEGAININYYDSDFLDKISKFDKAKPIFIYCLSGSRSSSASRKMARSGFENINDLEGGVISWMKNGQKLVK
ncbi:MAG: rhodanese-like domain-containing protein [Flavobacteriaceae bacterium]|nr:rhodanese-like domain-containing protein [Flavobacteriaceae bacterium]MCB0474168.1 rhodanese-like domain-containing protein [Flavobacteriaceae bacterium]